MDNFNIFFLSGYRIHLTRFRDQRGFTLIELMFVIVIIGIVAGSALPNFTAYRNRARVCEAMTISGGIRRAVGDFYASRGVFPQNNTDLGLQAKDQLPGKYTESIEIKNGAIHILFNYEVLDEGENIISLRPAVVEAYPQGNTMAWICGYGSPAEGMIAYGENRTSIRKDHLPRVCW